MATTYQFPDAFDLNLVRGCGELIRAAIAAAGASDPRVVDEVARGLTPRDAHLEILVSSRPHQSLFRLVQHRLRRVRRERTAA